MDFLNFEGRKEFRRFTDPNHPLVTAFREEVCEDNGAPKCWAQKKISHETAQNELPLVGGSPEDVYRVTQKKWDNYRFETVEAFSINDRIIAVSGARAYGPYLRIFMCHYLLKSFRSKSKGLAWREGGFLDQHIQFALANNYKAVFFSIYPHNRRLERFVRYLSLKKTNRTKPFLGKFSKVPDYVHFNNIDQHIFYHMLAPTENFDTLWLTQGEV